MDRAPLAKNDYAKIGWVGAPDRSLCLERWNCFAAGTGRAHKLDVVKDRVTSPLEREDVGSSPTWAITADQ